MQNVLTVVVGYLGKISLPGLGVIDIIEIGRKIRPFCSNNPSFHVVSSLMLCRFLSSKQHNNRIVTHTPA